MLMHWAVMGLTVAPSILCLFLLPVPWYPLSQVVCGSQGSEEFFRHNLNARQAYSTFPLFPPRRKTSSYVWVDGIIPLEGVL